jgi:hypothetical protein
MRKLVFLSLALVCLPGVLVGQTGEKEASRQITTRTVQARKVAPTGQEIASHFAAAKLDNEKATTTKIQGKDITVVPASSGKDKPGVGEAIALLETQLTGDETTLPPGKYNLFLAKVGTRWRCYAEANGRIVAQAASVSVVNEEGPEKPVISPKGWTIRMTCRNGHCTIYIRW